MGSNRTAYMKKTNVEDHSLFSIELHHTSPQYYPQRIATEYPIIDSVGMLLHDAERVAFSHHPFIRPHRAGGKATATYIHDIDVFYERFAHDTVSTFHSADTIPISMMPELTSGKSLCIHTSRRQHQHLIEITDNRPKILHIRTLMNVSGRKTRTAIRREAMHRLRSLDSRYSDCARLCRESCTDEFRVGAKF